MKNLIIGGGAAGIFAAIRAKSCNQKAEVIVLERSAQLLSKVKISGGGRCNVTHRCFEPKELILNYPRGGKELLAPFHRFQPSDTIEWFESRGVLIKSEPDGRMFPITDQSTSIINCLLLEAEKLGVEIRKQQKILSIDKTQTGFNVTLTSELLSCDHLLLTTGSSPQGLSFAQQLGHTITTLQPSLFTFNIPTSPLLDLAGISLPKVTLSLPESNFKQTGPLLITHWGFSGPVALKLSSWAARELYNCDYKTKLLIDWLPDFSLESLLADFKKLREQGRTLFKSPHHIPNNLWKKLLELADIDCDKKPSNNDLQRLCKLLKSHPFLIEGKTTNKEEFVTCGGVVLKEVNFKTMESRLCPKLFFAGEILDIDAVTGGFNFQNAWTTGWIAGEALGDDRLQRIA